MNNPLKIKEKQTRIACRSHGLCLIICSLKDFDSCMRCQETPLREDRICLKEVFVIKGKKSIGVFHS